MIKEEIMNEIDNRVWNEYMQVKGGDFLNWYEGLSPIEKNSWSRKFDEAQEREKRSK